MTSALDEACAALGQGRVVAAATETFFGLLADATSVPALDRLFRLKPRSAGVALVLPHRAAWAGFVEGIPPLADSLADRFWPGPLTIALPVAAGVDARLTVDGTVGVRLPGASPAAELTRAYGRALTATSANPHGEPPATHSDQVLRYFDAALRGGELFVVPGQAPGAAASTIVLVRCDGVNIVRQGAIPERDIRATAGRAG